MGSRVWFIILVYAVFKCPWALEVIPGKPEVRYYNPKYARYFNMSVRRSGRSAPYTISLDAESLVGIGDNFTYSLIIYENLSGNFQPTMLRWEMGVCAFFCTEPIVGAMFWKQFPQITCPIPKGRYEIRNAVIHMEKFAYNIPFTLSQLTVQTRGDIKLWHAESKEQALDMSVYLTFKQRPAYIKVTKPKSKGPPKKAFKFPLNSSNYD